MRNFSFFLGAALLLASCSTPNIQVTQKLPVQNKTIAIVPFQFSEVKKNSNKKKDSVCTCIAQSAQQTMTPYLQQAGFTVSTLPVSPEWTLDRVAAWADSTHIDYVLTATGLVHSVGTSVFMDQLAIKMIHAGRQEVFLSGNFAGSTTRVVQASQKMGAGIVKALK